MTARDDLLNSVQTLCQAIQERRPYREDDNNYAPRLWPVNIDGEWYARLAYVAYEIDDSGTLWATLEVGDFDGAWEEVERWNTADFDTWDDMHRTIWADYRGDTYAYLCYVRDTGLDPIGAWQTTDPRKLRRLAVQEIDMRPELGETP